ncbi:ChaN family lipoprotein [Salipiger sp. P9]|uniref:ChaN family lipoprotein n=1 Tax=Salipiger pentaromativorans TaxID=2943193 RepID=UPI0021573692|nr:ChaN family lipoprotein [Salipiger pentaromativorans]MCR8550768.1 ChaN family lipoprotein [Salipiger pentaromativorans]
MMRSRLLFAPLVALSLSAPAAFAEGSVFDGAQVLFLGETHDNPAHHARQAELVRELQPVALVFEMLTTDQSAQIHPEHLADEAALAELLQWEDSGWPDFAMYYPIFEAAPEAAIFGAALPREEARRVSGEPLDKVFGASAGFYGLDQPLPAEEQGLREEMQMAAHCDALPVEMLPVMVGIQRLRDARLAETALEALSMHGAPVVVITGNGHARTDWGAPALIARAAPEVKVVSLGQGEAGKGAPDGSFDLVEETEGVEREDPCAAFQKTPGN